MNSVRSDYKFGTCRVSYLQVDRVSYGSCISNTLIMCMFF